MSRNVIGNKKFSRKDYESVKKMDRHQFEMFCKDLVEQGQQSALNIRPELGLEDVRIVLSEAKGIGKERAEQIIAALEERMEGKKVDS